jgi:predicted TIM-barrel fold metal-dependent hydrolase
MQYVSRRSFLGACSSMAAVSGLPALAAAPTPRLTDAIDVHHHLVPPFYLEAMMQKQLQIAGAVGSQISQWTPARSIDEMDRDGIAASLVSISTPGIWLNGPDVSRALARRCNEFAAKMVADYPKRFGFMAAVPLPDIDGSLAEIAYALDTLEADGVGLITSYDSRWLGDPHYDPVFDELNRRKAKIFVHPTTADCCVNLLPGIASSYIEFPFDTTRAVMNLLYGGTLARCPDVRFIFSHGGGALPMINSRMKALATQPQYAARMPLGFDGELRRHFYDTASVTNAPAFAALSKYVPLSQILFGTDYPFGAPVSTSIAGLLELGMTRANLRRVERDNARALFPRF